jgi:hypothetical protein
MTVYTCLHGDTCTTEGIKQGLGLTGCVLLLTHAPLPFSPFIVHPSGQTSYTDEDNVSCRMYGCFVSDLLLCLLLSQPDIHQMISH